MLLGKELLGPFVLQREWQNKDFKELVEVKADLAIFSYSLGEINEIEVVLKKLWQFPIETFVIIEPGTPTGYKNILRARDTLIQCGAYIVAPCPHAKRCPLMFNDWCHFSVRLERSKWHRFVKEG